MMQILIDRCGGERHVQLQHARVDGDGFAHCVPPWQHRGYVAACRCDSLGTGRKPWSACTELYGVTLSGLLIGPVFNYPLTQLPHFVTLGVTEL
jgi:hypothetical protein